jgi:hypothetical protein
MLSRSRNNVGDSAPVIHAVKIKANTPMIQLGNTNHPSNAIEPRIQALGLHI